MPKFRKRPVVIEAFQMTEKVFTTDHPNDLHIKGVIYSPKERCAYINTLEGRMKVNLGDWIIQGIKGELYPCKPDIFEATYEPVDDAIPVGVGSEVD